MAEAVEMRSQLLHVGKGTFDCCQVGLGGAGRRRQRAHTPLKRLAYLERAVCCKVVVDLVIEWREALLEEHVAHLGHWGEGPGPSAYEGWAGAQVSR